MAIQQFPLPEAGIPSGNTASRPAAPVIGSTYYNGELEILEIYNGTSWVAVSAPPAVPAITVADVGTSIAYGAAQGLISITEGTIGGDAESFLISASTGGFTATTSGTTVNITVGSNGSYTFTGQGISKMGASVSSESTSATLTTVPQAPTIGTASTSGVTADVTVTWTLQSTGGKNLSSISIVPYLNGTTAQTSQTAATTSSTSHTFTGLTGGSSYTFKVKTINANGASLESSATNSITVPVLLTVDYLVIAGGAGGGNYTGGGSGYGAGGGGAGGYRTSAGTSGANSAAESSFSAIGSTNYTVTVGAGGALSAAGNNSVFNTITSTGGGGGGDSGTSSTNGDAGGCGGGAGSNNVTNRFGGAGTANQGFAGGNMGGASSFGAAGGGGAGAVGGDRASNTGGAGGIGISSSITGSAVTRAGGGGGGGANGGAGGSGGGGVGASDSGAASQPGTANTGGGGGGDYQNLDASAGGSGVVILRYPDTNTITIGAGLTGSTSAASGGYKRTTLTAGTGNVSWV
jgi:hypothetical protein